MSIKAAGGVFGRNPTFNDVTVEGDLSVAGTLSVGGNVLSGLDFEGAWDATSGAPSATPSTGQFWIVSVAGTTDLSGITNWGIGDWALYDGSVWQRIEGGADGNFNQLTSSGTTILNGTTIPASKTLLVTTDIGSTVEAYDATILKSADIGSTVQGYDADTAKYDDTTANFTGTLQNGGSNVVVDTDIGSTVQAYDATILKSADIGSTVQGYDADTAKLDTAQTWTATQNFAAASATSFGVGTTSPDGALEISSSSANEPIVKIATAHPSGTNGRLEFETNWSGNIAVKASIEGSSENATNGHLVFKTQQSGSLTEAARFTYSGNLAFPSGNGIDFSATAGTGTSELFDDYEEGTWTPTLENGTGITYTTQSGKYVKVGNLVYIECYLNVATSSADASNIAIGGLPYAPNPISGQAACTLGIAEVDFDSPFLDVPTNGIPHLNYLSSSSTLVLNQTYNDCNSSGKLRLAANYRT
jgi:hypothetical protein